MEYPVPQPSQSWMQILNGFEACAVPQESLGQEPQGMPDLFNFLSGIPQVSPPAVSKPLSRSSSTASTYISPTLTSTVLDFGSVTDFNSTISSISSSSTSLIDAKEEQRKAVNRKASAKHRLKKIAEAKQKEEELKNLRDENARLKASLEQLQRGIQEEVHRQVCLKLGQM